MHMFRNQSMKSCSMLNSIRLQTDLNRLASDLSRYVDWYFLRS